MTDGRCTPAARPHPLEPEYLLVERIGERAGPRLELFVKELLKDGGQGAFLADALITRGLVHQRNDADAGEPSKKYLASFSETELPGD